MQLDGCLTYNQVQSLLCPSSYYDIYRNILIYLSLVPSNNGKPLFIFTFIQLSQGRLIGVNTLSYIVFSLLRRLWVGSLTNIFSIIFPIHIYDYFCWYIYNNPFIKKVMMSCPIHQRTFSSVSLNIDYTRLSLQ